MEKGNENDMIKDYRELISLFMQTGDIMDQYVRRNSGGAFADPQRGQGRVMALLRMAPEVSQRDLVYLLGISKQALGELLSKLENCGYIERHPSESDRRVMMVTLTEKGKEAAEEMNQTQDRSAELFTCLKEGELDNLKDYLERIIAANLDLLSPRHRSPGPGPEGHRPPGPGPGGYGEFGGQFEGHRPPGPGPGGYGEFGGQFEGHRPPGPGPEFNGYAEFGGRSEGHRPPGPGPEFNGYVEFGGRGGGQRSPGPGFGGQGPEGHRPPGPGPEGHRPPGPGFEGHGPDGHRPPRW